MGQYEECSVVKRPPHKKLLAFMYCIFNKGDIMSGDSKCAGPDVGSLFQMSPCSVWLKFQTLLKPKHLKYYWDEQVPVQDGSPRCSLPWCLPDPSEVPSANHGMVGEFRRSLVKTLWLPSTLWHSVASTQEVSCSKMTENFNDTERLQMTMSGKITAGDVRRSTEVTTNGVLTDIRVLPRQLEHWLSANIQLSATKSNEQIILYVDEA